MKYSINGSTVALNKNILSEESLNIMIKEIDSSYNSCSKAIEAYNLVSNVKAMESFGYKATEGLGESIKNGAKAVWEKIKEFFQNMSNFFKTQYVKLLTVGSKGIQMEVCKAIADKIHVIIGFIIRDINKIENNVGYVYNGNISSDEQLKHSKEVMHYFIELRNILIRIVKTIKRVDKKYKNFHGLVIKDPEDTTKTFYNTADVVLEKLNKIVDETHSVYNSERTLSVFGLIANKFKLFIDSKDYNSAIKKFDDEAAKLLDD